MRAGVRRGSRIGAGLSALLLVISALSVNAITAGITVPEGAEVPAIGPPSHTFGLLSDDAEPSRGPIPRAAFERARPIPARGPAAFGGDRIYDIDVDGTSYRVHEFTTVGDSTFTVARPNLSVDYLVAGGGGGGGAWVGGGGGGGGALAGTTSLTGPITVTVGAGGVGAVYSQRFATSGAASALGQSISAAGGGHGGSWNWQAPGAGGNGGDSGNAFSGGAGRGDGTNGYPTGGGGGAGGLGQAWSTTKSGDGGIGLASVITGIEGRYGGGGGGGIHGNSVGTNAVPGAGRDGGGDGAAQNTAPLPTQNGQNGRGGGGGGGGGDSATTTFGGNGGSGIVIVRYEIPRTVWAPIAATGGSVTEYVADGTNGTAGFRYRVHTFAADGSFNVSDAGSSGEVDVLLVGGGGGGGTRHGGGGGGGGVLEAPGRTVAAGANPVVVGEGGVGMTDSTDGANGEDSTFLDLVARGGGRGGGARHVPASGATGGGAHSSSVAAGTSMAAGQGFGGGAGVNGSIESGWGGGGGGGAGGAGSSATGGGANDASAGSGGVGRASTLSGVSVVYGGGGGGSISHLSNGRAGAGGAGGGGAGASLGWEFFTHTVGSHPTTRAALDSLFSGATRTDFGAASSFVAASAGVATGTLADASHGPVNILNWNNTPELYTVIPDQTVTDQLALRVTGTFVPAQTGYYRFTSSSDDSTEITIDGVPLAWYYGGRGVRPLADGMLTAASGQATIHASAPVQLVAGQAYRFVARMHEIAGGEGLRIFWSRSDTATMTPITQWFQYEGELTAVGRDGADGFGGGGGAGGFASGTNVAGGDGGDGVIVVRYPLDRLVTDLPSGVRDVIAGEGETSAVLRWRVPQFAPPALDLTGYRIEYAATSGNTWTTLTSGVTFSTSGSSDETVVTAQLTGIPDTSRHRLRITPLGSVDGPSTIVTPVAKGGDSVTLVGDDVVHSFTAVGNANFDLGQTRQVDYLVVGGGGGGGTGWDGAPGGGGGAGGVLQGSDDVAEGARVSVTVGASGAGGSGGPGFDDPGVDGMATRGRDGSPSRFGALNAPGGGGGGEARANGGSGASGGGAGGRHNIASSRSGGVRTSAGVGNLGGGSRSTSSTGAGGGGGGGAGGPGASPDGTIAGGAGGAGVTSSVTGAPVAYAGGGTGGAFGVASDVPGAAATVRGSGGSGGAKAGNGGVAGGPGADGVVIVRYSFHATVPALGGDVVYDILDDGVAYRVHEFRAVGTSTFEVLRETEVEYLVVGGGASGTRGQCNVYWGHGGGGGGVSAGSVRLVAGDVDVTVGAGGVGAVSQDCNVLHSGRAGDASSIVHAATISASGGIGAGSRQQFGGASGTGTIDGVSYAARAGGSGGGTSLQAGGGGGAGGAANGRDGGPGITSTITGTAVSYGAGGAGRNSSGFGTPGAGTAGIGGGGSDAFGDFSGGFTPGGDGIVIVRYRIPSVGLDAPTAATGGTVATFVGDGTNGDLNVPYRVHTFLSDGTFSVASGSGDVEYLVVGGGGGGGNTMGGGGGAGGLRTGSVIASTRPVTVGTGGGGGSARTVKGANGGGSSFGDLAVSGGGGGGSWTASAIAHGSDGGSGGGASAITNGTVGGTAVVAAFGNPGGVRGGSTGSYARSGGGGGAATAGATGALLSGGGDGRASAISGTSRVYAAGGGGGTNGGTAGVGGSSGVGGRGSTACTFNGTVPEAGTGSGGGGGGYSGTSGCSGPGGAGATGIVIVRYPVGRAALFPSAVRDAIVGEGASTAVLRWQVPETDAPGPIAAAPSLDHYRIERQAIDATVWLPVGPDVTFSVTGTGADRVVTAELGDIPSDARHRFRITPRGTVDGLGVVVESVAKGGDTVALVGSDVVHSYTTVTSVPVAGSGGGTGGATCAATGVEHTLLLGAARNVQHLIVAGGGGGGSDNAGGGGGGGVLSATVLRAAGLSTVVVGGGGLASGINNENLQTNGCVSEVFALKAFGGGQGGNGQPNARARTAGGSGGGGHGELFSVAGPPTATGAVGTEGQGFSGGDGLRHPSTNGQGEGGGGGGAGGPGQNAASLEPGDGGIGRAAPEVTGTNRLYGSGGGGGTHRNLTTAPSLTKSGSGGTGLSRGLGGSLGDVDGGDGENGFGGGGGGSATTSRSGGAGGSGTVILRYPFAG